MCLPWPYPLPSLAGGPEPMQGPDQGNKRKYSTLSSSARSIAVWGSQLGKGRVGQNAPVCDAWGLGLGTVSLMGIAILFRLLPAGRRAIRYVLAHAAPCHSM